MASLFVFRKFVAKSEVNFELYLGHTDEKDSPRGRVPIEESQQVDASAEAHRDPQYEAHHTRKCCYLLILTHCRTNIKNIVC